MSEIENVEQTRNQLTTNYDVSKFLLGNNSFVDGSLTASGDTELLQGMVMGRIAATQLLVPCDKDATDGSQFPVGLCVVDQTILDGVTATVRLVNKGKVAESKVNFADTETLATLIGPANNQRSYRDYINDLGLELAGGDELTIYDND